MRTMLAGRSAALFVAAVAVALVWSPAWQRRSAAAEPAVAKELCNRLWTEYSETARSGDWEKVAGWFTKDAVLIYPDMAELRGRDAIRAHFQAFQGVKFLSMTFSLTHFGVVGDEAFTFASLSEAYQQGTGPEVKEDARCGVVWQRQPDGTWQISHFLVNHVKP
jgi:uncharacterized protein (TIGR02246 family)